VYIGDFNVPYSNESGSEYYRIKKLLEAEPPFNYAFNTIGNFDNTSHYNLSWWLGSLVWNDGQIDHALISNDYTKKRTFEVINMKKNGVNLTDHELIIVTLDS